MTLLVLRPNINTHHDIALQRIAQAREQFGEETPPELPGMSPRWILTPAQLPSAIEFAFEDERFAKQRMGPSILNFAFSFDWKNFRAEPNELISSLQPRQDSILGITLGQHTLYLGPTLIFPGDYQSDGTRSFIASIEETLPFRFRENYFQRWLFTKGGSKLGRYRKLDHGWRQSLQQPD
jgi:hypothetical protein